MVIIPAPPLEEGSGEAVTTIAVESIPRRVSITGQTTASRLIGLRAPLVSIGTPRRTIMTRLRTRIQRGPITVRTQDPHDGPESPSADRTEASSPRPSGGEVEAGVTEMTPLTRTTPLEVPPMAPTTPTAAVTVLTTASRPSLLSTATTMLAAPSLTTPCLA